MTQPNTDMTIPEGLNWVILAISLIASWGVLWVGSHASLPWALGAAVLFALINNTPFALLHEAVHGVASPHAGRNALMGILSAAAFPTSFTMQKIAHLGHHRRNRTDEELYDYYLPHQSRALRSFQLYAGNLLGLYWFCIPVSNLLYLALPWVYVSPRFITGPARVLGFEPYVRDIAAQPIWRIWLECLVALVYQAGVYLLLDLDWQGWVLCHWAFALHWSALQYVDHAWTPRHVTEGAWNLKVLPISRYLALNYHYHLAHHRHPQAPWIHLPRLVDPGEPQPTFWSIYFSLWGGVKPAPPMEPTGVAQR